MIEFLDSWLWAGFIVVGLLMVLLELFIGVETGFDLVILGSALIISGLLTSSLDSWLATAIVASALCLLYVALGRRYVKAKMKVGDTRTNVDAIVGKSGFVKKGIEKNSSGLVTIGNEDWRAKSEDNISIDEGEEITVVDVSGVTLIVKRRV
ncbi:MAG: NfeD family protein [Halobacteriota archaeon]|nr:NfeD family protein [Halobacteriota archaeon]